MKSEKKFYVISLKGFYFYHKSAENCKKQKKANPGSEALLGTEIY